MARGAIRPSSSWSVATLRWSAPGPGSQSATPPSAGRRRLGHRHRHDLAAGALERTHRAAHARRRGHEQRAQPPCEPARQPTSISVGATAWRRAKYASYSGSEASREANTAAASPHTPSSISQASRTPFVRASCAVT